MKYKDHFFNDNQMVNFQKFCLFKNPKKFEDFENFQENVLIDDEIKKEIMEFNQSKYLDSLIDKYSKKIN